MSELIATHISHTDFRKHLLATVSMLAFTTLAAAPSAQAQDADRPTVWIELGGQMEFPQGTSSPDVAPFMAKNAGSGAFAPVSPLDAQKAPRFSFGEEGKISIQPKHSDWMFSIGLRYGRSTANRFVHQQTKGVPLSGGGKGGRHYASAEVNYAEFKNQQNESHLVLDFQAGKDVGLGLFGKDGSSVFSAGVRLARFSSSATTSMRMRPDIRVSNVLQQSALKYNYFFHHYSLNADSQRSFHGIGPSLSWDGSASLLGNPSEGELGIDWNANAAVLFGRQKMIAHHHTTGYFLSKKGLSVVAHKSAYDHPTNPVPRSRSVIVPNIGGSFAIAYRFEAAKLDFGYRADFYLNAMDTGWDARQTSNVLFHGPFATLSIGLGG